jgi:Uma2 family endonuclease
MTHPIATAPAPLPEDDPFRYGWRYVRRPTPDDPNHLEQVPLTLEDVLHPEVGDFIVHSDRHETDRMYLTAVLRARLEPHGQAIVLSDVRVAWDVPDLRPHGPDVMVIPGLRERRDWSTFDVAEEGVRPALIIEITSPETRENDVVRKVRSRGTSATGSGSTGRGGSASASGGRTSSTGSGCPRRGGSTGASGGRTSTCSSRTGPARSDCPCRGGSPSTRAGG